jgi:hypothetical protein
VSVFPAEAQYQSESSVKVPKYFSKTILPSFKMINPLVFFCSRKSYKLSILLEHQFNVVGLKVSQSCGDAGGNKLFVHCCQQN